MERRLLRSNIGDLDQSLELGVPGTIGDTFPHFFPQVNRKLFHNWSYFDLGIVKALSS